MSEIKLEPRYPDSRPEDITDALVRWYAAGYRDGSIHYELKHCPACKNIADLQEALEENAKLRELVGDIWEFGFSNSAGANSVKEWYRIRDELEQRVYVALGMEVH